MDCKFPQHHGSDSGGGGGGGIAGAIIVILAALVGAAIVPFLGMIFHIILGAVAVMLAVATATLALTVRSRVRHRAVGQSPVSAALGHGRPRQGRQALPEAAEGGVHHHYHLGGMTPEAMRHVLSQQEPQAWRASVEKD
jgi:hypothetical protein